MLKLLEQKTISLSKVAAPGDIAQRQKLPHVQRLAESFKSTGGEPMQPITVCRKTMELVAGADRFAAMLLADVKKARVQFVSGEPRDIERARAIENAVRRHGDQARWVAELARLENLDICPQTSCDSDGKPPHGTKAEVVRRVAEKTGMSEAAVQKSIQRQAAKDAPPDQPPPSQDVAIETFGQPVPKTVQEDVNDCDTGLREIRSIVRQATKKLGELEGVLGRTFLRLREGLRQADYECIAELPVTLCFACKAIPTVRQQCNTCGGRAYVGDGLAKLASPELLEGGAEAGVYYQGKWYSCEKARGLKP